MNRLFRSQQPRSSSFARRALTSMTAMASVQTSSCLLDIERCLQHSQELIWSGACQFGNRNAHDFKMIENGSNTNYMSVIMGSLDPSKRDPSGAGVTMDRSFNVQKTLSPATSDETFNMHEFTVLENGDKALHIISNPIYADVSSLSSNRTKDWIFDGGFQERNLATGEVLFEWSCLKSGVVFSESDKELHGQPTAEEPWDWL